MGHGAQDNRRALIDHVKGCIAQVNAMTALATDVREANNSLATQVAADVASLTARLDTLSAWCKRLERHETVTREVAHDALNAVETARGEAHIALTTLPLLGRLRWLLTGYLPPLEPMNRLVLIPPPDLPAEKVTKLVVGDNALGRIGSAGMAPRPLP